MRAINHLMWLAALFVAGAASGMISGCGGAVMDERKPMPQEAAERVVAEGRFQILDTLDAAEPSFNPAVVRLASGGDVLVFDAGSARVLRYDAEGSIVTRYGSGPGAGPGEHRRVVDLGEFESGRIWSFDQQSGAVNVFESSGTFVQRIELKEPVYFMSARSADRLIGVNPAVAQPFRFHDADGSVTGSFGWLLDEPGDGSVPYIGRVMPIENGGFVYAMQSADILKAWNDEGTLLWHRRMIDGFEPPGIYREEGGSAFLDHPNGRSTITRMPLNVSDGRIHVFVVNSTAEIVFIDTYDADDGSYVGSRRVPVTENACVPQYVRGVTAWMVCSGPTLVRVRIPEL